MIDTVDLMLQAGVRALPKSPLREGFVRPANAKEIVRQALTQDLIGEDSSSSSFWTDDMTWYGPVGYGMATNKQEYEDVFISSLRTAFSDRQLDIDILTCEGTYCGVNGYLHGVNTGDFLGEKAP